MIRVRASFCSQNESLTLSVSTTLMGKSRLSKALWTHFITLSKNNIVFQIILSQVDGRVPPTTVTTVAMSLELFQTNLMTAYLCPSKFTGWDISACHSPTFNMVKDKNSCIRGWFLQIYLLLAYFHKPRPFCFCLPPYLLTPGGFLLVFSYLF